MSCSERNVDKRELPGLAGVCSMRKGAYLRATNKGIFCLETDYTLWNNEDNVEEREMR